MAESEFAEAYRLGREAEEARKKQPKRAKTVLLDPDKNPANHVDSPYYNMPADPPVRIEIPEFIRKQLKDIKQKA